jgi:bacteriophage Mu gam like protein|nr:MAG TPA: hypothetical protein [Myoviridae sp. ct6nn14]
MIDMFDATFDPMNPYNDVQDDIQAEQCLQEIRRINEESQRLLNVCKAQIDFYTARAKQIEEERDKKKSDINGKLSIYFQTVPHNSTKTQETYKLASGVLKLKKPSPEYKHNDSLLAEAFPEFVENVPKFRWGEFKKTLNVVREGYDTLIIHKDTGEVVPAGLVEIVDREPEFVVEV